MSVPLIILVVLLHLCCPVTQIKSNDGNKLLLRGCAYGQLHVHLELLSVVETAVHCRQIIYNKADCYLPYCRLFVF